MTIRYPINYNAAYLLLFVTFTACSTSTQPSNDVAEKREYLEQVNEVDYKIMMLEDFEQEFISNGKLEAAERVVIKFKVGGQVAALKVKNGDYVTKGAVLATLHQQEYQRAIEDASIALKKAKVDMLDFLLGQGYQVKDSLKVPADLREIAAVRSGFSTAENQMKKAQYELAQTIIRAPFSGKVANLQWPTYKFPCTTRWEPAKRYDHHQRSPIDSGISPGRDRNPPHQTSGQSKCNTFRHYRYHYRGSNRNKPGGR